MLFREEFSVSIFLNSYFMMLPLLKVSVLMVYAAIAHV